MNDVGGFGPVVIGVFFVVGTFARGTDAGVLFSPGAAAFDFGAVFWITSGTIEGVFFFEATGMNLGAPTSDVVGFSSSRGPDSFPDDEDFDA